MDRLITYSLLAEIRERRSNLKSLIEIFQELAESVIANSTLSSDKKGTLEDLRASFTDTFGIPIPFPVVKNILTRIHRQKGDQFTLFADYSFLSADGLFSSLERDVANEQAQYEELISVYTELCRKKGLQGGEGLLMHIENNKRELISFLTSGELRGKYSEDVQRIFAILYSVPKFKKPIEKLVFGSLISAYMEIDLPENDNRKTLLLDTNFLASLLDLHSEESFATCNSIVTIADKLKYVCCVLPETIKELRNLLKKKSGSIKKGILFSGQNKKSIEYGCFRRHLSSAELLTVAERLEQLMYARGIKMLSDQTNNQLSNEARQSDLFHKLKDRPFNREGAIHDVMAMLYVKKLRTGSETSFSDTNSFFVTDTPGYLENKIALKANLPYLIRAEELLNILWLANPIADELVLRSDIGRLLSLHLEEKLPDKQMLLRIDEKLRKFGQMVFNEQDCVDLALRIAEVDAKELGEFLAEEEEEVLREKLYQLAQRARTAAAEKDAEYKRDVEVVLALISDRYEEKQEAEGSKHRDEVHEVISSYDVKIAATEKALLTEAIARDTETIDDLAARYSRIEKSLDRRKRAAVILTLALIAISLVAIGKYIVIPNWSWIEPVTYLYSLFLPVPYLLFAAIGRSVRIDAAVASIVNWFFRSSSQELVALGQRINKVKQQAYLNQSRLNQLLV